MNTQADLQQAVDRLARADREAETLPKLKADLAQAITDFSEAERRFEKRSDELNNAVDRIKKEQQSASESLKSIRYSLPMSAAMQADLDRLRARLAQTRAEAAEAHKTLQARRTACHAVLREINRQRRAHPGDGDWLAEQTNSVAEASSRLDGLRKSIPEIEQLIEQIFLANANSIMDDKNE
tara:strand:+ start:14999 stop:15544 length:546 start_codon:yes stop_codon:yes gene_type:complete